MASPRSTWENEQREFRRIEKAFAKCTSIILRKLVGLANIGLFVRDQAPEAFRRHRVLRAQPRPQWLKQIERVQKRTQKLMDVLLRVQVDRV